MDEFDVIVLGMGPGGEDAAGRLVEAGLSVAAVEADLVGGECPYWGCVPSKMMIRAAHVLGEARRVSGLAGAATVSPDWTPVARRIRAEATDDWNDQAAADRFEKKGGHLVRGHGVVTGPREVTVGDRVLRARRGLLISTGTRPAIPDIDGLAGTPYWTNHEAVATESVPESMIVLGGGAIGLELAQVFARFGTEITLLEAAPTLLPGEEPEAGALIAKVFRDEGMRVLTGASASRVSYDGRFAVTVGDEVVEAANLLVVTGRKTDLTGLSVIGVDETARFIPTDPHMRVTDGVWAAGDVTGHGGFTHVANYQGRIAALDILGEEVAGADYRAVPRVTYTDPEVGAVGLTERQARDEGLSVTTGITTAGARDWIHGTKDILIKLVASDDVLVGATAVGPAGGEVMGALAVAVHARVPVMTLRSMMYAYPTFHRGIEDALKNLLKQDRP
ncbi:NAD(P)/FAD-dependent oxidoreductase [Herbidospora sp. NBRC 101105]|uniref:dihydrolipoyl dehydrogenase family protein n=1 Tax=Herbidospora sp. NBRC 101105 TaxID=3032195 RepID=UPI0024A0E73D|nr:NAD(P)/FAD-dependent oxidoreductase [Herbidospora sp. NBRC 101105]GLX97890.1 pyridine nucleotide-disulfide oxidoreductase [Herbidospora sp. NBRC 101105]